MNHYQNQPNFYFTSSQTDILPIKPIILIMCHPDCAVNNNENFLIKQLKSFSISAKVKNSVFLIY